VSKAADKIMEAFIRNRSMTERQAQSVREEIIKFVDELLANDSTHKAK
jgi:hypothetical protein